MGWSCGSSQIISAAALIICEKSQGGTSTGDGFWRVGGGAFLWAGVGRWRVEGWILTFGGGRVGRAMGVSGRLTSRSIEMAH